MSTNSLVLKSTLFPEWYSERIQPWLHYVPVKTDYTDLYPILAFFKGAPGDGRGGHDELAGKIALAGKEWAEQNWCAPSHSLPVCESRSSAKLTFLRSFQAVGRHAGVPPATPARVRAPRQPRQPARFVRL